MDNNDLKKRVIVWLEDFKPSSPRRRTIQTTIQNKVNDRFNLDADGEVEKILKHTSSLSDAEVTNWFANWAEKINIQHNQPPQVHAYNTRLTDTQKIQADAGKALFSILAEFEPNAAYGPQAIQTHAATGLAGKSLFGGSSTEAESSHMIGGYIKTSKGKRKIRTGKRGGKYIMMGGKKKYLK